MPSRQDQLHSYQFAVQRVVAALVMRETDPAQSPFRRAAGATLASVLIAVIALGAVAVYGVFTGGGTTQWRTENAFVVEKDSGARFVYMDGKLHPVLNYTSALLLAKSAKKPISVSRKSIADVPRGNMVGIPNAPDALPVTTALARYPWTVCSAAIPNSNSGPLSTLLMGIEPSGGTKLEGKGILIQDPGGDVHLLWNNRRHLLRGSGFVRSALGWSGQPTVDVAAGLVNSVPAGGDLGQIDIPDRGDNLSYKSGSKVGEVFSVKGTGKGGDQYAVAMSAGFAPITEVQLRLILADPRTGSKVGQREPTSIALGDFTALPRLDALTPSGVAPLATIPELAAAESGAICTVTRDDGGIAEVWVQATPPDISPTSAAIATPKRSADGAVLADYVRVPPGKGAVVEAVSAPGAQGGTLSVVTDLGQRHAVPSAEVLESLGLKVSPVRVPANVVALLPAGPALDPAAARDPAGQV